MTVYGGIETGGTSVGCMIAGGPDDIIAETRFTTTTPAETIENILSFLKYHSAASPVTGVGIGAFGPVDLDRRSPTYGFITSTPKPGWSQVDLCGPIEQGLQVPVSLDTDVNAAALGEYLWGLEDGETAPPDPLLYLTVGTGIGLGVVMDGAPLHGLLHPEAGHMRIPHDHELDPFAGSCPFHGDCWEGLASGYALEKRWGQRPETLPDDHPAWALEARYLGLGIANLVYCLSPRRVVIGGGVIRRPGLMEQVRRETQNAIGDYLKSDMVAERIDELIVSPRLGDRSGLLGAVALAMRPR